MKISKFAVIFSLILLPFFVIININVSQNRESLVLTMQYNHAMDTATQDAAKALITNARQNNEAQYESTKKVRINQQEAVDTFFNTLYLNFSVFDDEIGKGVINNYVPIIVIVGYDGYYLYYMDEYINKDGQKEYKHVWSPKKPYAHQDEYGNSFGFSLDDFVKVHRNSDQKWFEGLRGEISSTTDVPLLKDPDTFDSVRRTTIVNSLQNDLEYYINKYNNYNKRIGVSYTFTLPLISEEDWTNSINDVGVLSFVQGIPMGDKYYNNYALGGSRIIKKTSYAGIFANGLKYYYPLDRCTSTFEIEEVFTSQKDAVSNGYIPLKCQRTK